MHWRESALVLTHRVSKTLTTRKRFSNFAPTSRERDIRFSPR
jgi:hypothetical protein